VEGEFLLQKENSHVDLSNLAFYRRYYSTYSTLNGNFLREVRGWNSSFLRLTYTAL